MKEEYDLVDTKSQYLWKELDYYLVATKLPFLRDCDMVVTTFVILLTKFDLVATRS